VAGKDYKVCVRSIFQPLATAAGRLDLLDKLTTLPVPDDRRKEQYARFKSFKIDGSDVVYLPNGGFAALYVHHAGRYVAISTAGLIRQDEETLTNWASSHEFEPEELDECTFMCLAHHLKGYFRLADEYRSKDEALNVIDVIAPDYQGHAFDRLYSYYRPVFLFRIPADSTFFSAGVFTITTDLCCNNPALRSPIIDDELVAPLTDLSAMPAIAAENLFQALTASHFRHAFLELYRCIESIFYLPWMLDLKAASKIHTRAVDLKQTCRTSLNWREKEEPSMERIFGLLPGDKQLDETEDAIELIKDLKNADEFERSQLGKRLYAIRNGMVHHEDYERPNQYRPNDQQWRFLALYLALALVRIVRSHERDLTPAEPMEASDKSEAGEASNLAAVGTESGA
jgi:hypothetical protein